jgi:hypothetical protein
LNDSRQSVVDFIFSKLDKNKSGFIEEEELTEFFEKAPLPDILLGQIKPAIKSALFVKKYGHNHRLSMDDLTDYYIGKSVKIVSDDQFISACLGDWLLKEEDFERFQSESSASRVATTANGPLPVRRGSSALLRRRTSVEYAQSTQSTHSASTAIDLFDMLSRTRTRTGKRSSVSEIESDRLSSTIHCIPAPREPENFESRIYRSKAHGDLSILDSSTHSLPAETRSSNHASRPTHRGRKTSPADVTVTALLRASTATVSGSFTAQVQSPSEPTANYPTLSPEAPRRIAVPNPTEVTNGMEEAIRVVNSIPFSPSQGRELDATADRHDTQSLHQDDIAARVGADMRERPRERERQSPRIKRLDADVLLLRASLQTQRAPETETETSSIATAIATAITTAPDQDGMGSGMMALPSNPKGKGVVALNTSVEGESLSSSSESSADDNDNAQVDLAVLPSGDQNLVIHLSLLVDELQKSVAESRTVLMTQQRAIDTQEKMIENVRKALAQLSVATQRTGYPKG